MRTSEKTPREPYLYTLSSYRNDTKELERIAGTVSKHLGKPVTVDDMYCEGCQTDVRTIHCRVCAIRECAVSKGLTHCSQCQNFPCRRLTDFNNDQYPHHHEVLGNIEHMREIGTDACLEEQRQRWCCSDCGVAASWYDETCFPFGTALQNGCGRRED